MVFASGNEISQERCLKISLSTFFGKNVVDPKKVLNEIFKQCEWCSLVAMNFVLHSKTKQSIRFFEFCPCQILPLFFVTIRVGQIQTNPIKYGKPKATKSRFDLDLFESFFQPIDSIQIEFFSYDQTSKPIFF